MDPVLAERLHFGDLDTTLDRLRQASVFSVPRTVAPSTAAGVSWGSEEWVRRVGKGWQVRLDPPAGTDDDGADPSYGIIVRRRALRGVIRYDVAPLVSESLPMVPHSARLPRTYTAGAMIAYPASAFAGVGTFLSCELEAGRYVDLPHWEQFVWSRDAPVASPIRKTEVVDVAEATATSFEDYGSLGDGVIHVAPSTVGHEGHDVIRRGVTRGPVLIFDEPLPRFFLRRRYHCQTCDRFLYCSDADVRGQVPGAFRVSGMQVWHTYIFVALLYSHYSLRPNEHELRSFLLQKWGGYRPGSAPSWGVPRSRPLSGAARFRSCSAAPSHLTGLHRCFCGVFRG
jgi:hypothetical protein